MTEVLYFGSGGTVSITAVICVFQNSFCTVFLVCCRRLKVVWHGADTKGHADTDANCNAWTSDEPTMTGAGSSLTKHQLLGTEKYLCNNSLILLCIEINSRRDIFK